MDGRNVHTAVSFLIGGETMGYERGGGGNNYSNGFALIVVLFILLIIVGASFMGNGY